VKDATANLARASLQRHRMGPDFVQLSGEDATALGFMAHGGHGCISVTANVAPKLCAEFQSACLAGDFRAALVDPSPGPAKFALSLLGRMREDVRSPITPVGSDTREEVEFALRYAGLLN
jgi:4-hydroxy-tetrahydrodipicolinate synthase